MCPAVHIELQCTGAVSFCSMAGAASHTQKTVGSERQNSYGPCTTCSQVKLPMPAQNHLTKVNRFYAAVLFQNKGPSFKNKDLPLT